MTARPRRTSPVWSDVKGKLAAFDRAGLVGLVQDLYAASEANRTFLHARFGLGADLLAPYKAMIEPGFGPMFSGTRMCRYPPPRRPSRISERPPANARDWRS
jgi:hypothetical protein